ncbi:hypothetical protein ACSBR1_013050 [Camellia fascicularis]
MDWVSSLPLDIQRNILGRIPFEEVAGTSISSRRSNWSEHSLILDKLLFEERGQWIDELHPSAWVNKVEEILNNHREGLIPIQKFVLHIPDMQYKWGLYINIWLSYLSSNSIKELSVDNCNVITYKLSSILFEWSELTRLMLRNCAFYKSFGSFQNLRFLHLEKIAFGSVKVGDVTLSTPSLVWAELIDCTGFRYLDIQAPNLVNFVVATSVRMSRDDENHMRLKLAKPTIRIIDPNHSGSKLGFRVEYFFSPQGRRVRARR